jgi:hypothetical protein
MLIPSNGHQIDLLRLDHTQATAVAYLGSTAQWDSFAFVMVFRAHASATMWISF